LKGNSKATAAEFGAEVAAGIMSLIRDSKGAKFGFPTKLFTPLGDSE